MSSVIRTINSDRNSRNPEILISRKEVFFAEVLFCADFCPNAFFSFVKSSKNSDNCEFGKGTVTNVYLLFFDGDLTVSLHLHMYVHQIGLYSIPNYPNNLTKLQETIKKYVSTDSIGGT